MRGFSEKANQDVVWNVRQWVVFEIDVFYLYIMSNVIFLAYI